MVAREDSWTRDLSTSRRMEVLTQKRTTPTRDMYVNTTLLQLSV